MSKETNGDRKEFVSFKKDPKNLEKEIDDLFKPSKEDQKFEQEINILNKELAELRSSNDKKLRSTIRKNDQGIKLAEKALAKDPDNKTLKKALRGLEKIRANLSKIENR